MDSEAPEILLGGALGGMLVPKKVFDKLQDISGKLVKHYPGEPWKAMMALSRVMIEMGFRPGKAGCIHLDEGHCEYCLQDALLHHAFTVKVEHAAYFKEAALALHNPARYGEEKVKDLIKLLEEKADLCEDMREVVDFGKKTQGEFMLRHGIPQGIAK